jgi:hypothetical protein
LDFGVSAYITFRSLHFNPEDSQVAIKRLDSQVAIKQIRIEKKPLGKECGMVGRGIYFG